MSIADAILLIVSFLPAIILLSAIPYLTKPTQCFGVSIPEEASQLPVIKHLRKQYAIRAGITTSLLLLSILFLPFFPSSETIMAIVIVLFGFLLILTPFLIYLPFHKRMKQLKKEYNWKVERKERVIIDIKFRENHLVYSNGWFLIPIFISFLTILITIGMYPKLPDRLPAHFDLQGNVTRYTNKSIYTVSILPIVQIFATILMMAVNTAIKKAKQELNAANPEKSKKQNIVFRRHLSLFMIGSSILTVTLFFVIQLAVITHIPKVALMITTIIVLASQFIWILWLAFKIGQGGSRITTEKGEETLWVDYDNDEYWKWGMFYFNRNDPSLFVEKRFGIGLTVNFARPGAWVFTALPILLLISLLFLPLLD
ncbi:DUF1648 domain-containing protein [Thermaerobacillus caldiproteolyticus]|uniref:DUF1648 domain-containing protein n=1 Tax=Thermaerobacillus caldiproteolyticus TaxID=247480 RepID=UPI0018F113BE|nr:DUF5808 domain-containing protein [Anoxybacillus caldiproteolyticus]